MAANLGEKKVSGNKIVIVMSLLNVAVAIYNMFVAYRNMKIAKENLANAKANLATAIELKGIVDGAERS